MLQTNDFKQIKNKHIRKLYQNVYYHLDQIASMTNKEDVVAYQNLFKAYKNGYTSNHKMFKKLLKSNIKFPHIYIDWFFVYIDKKLQYLNKPELKRLDDLYVYAQLQSKLGFLMLITHQNAKLNLDMINTLSVIDIYTDILLNDDTYLLENKIHYPTGLIEDFGVEKNLDGHYLKNEQYVGLWEYLLFKVQSDMKLIMPQHMLFQPYEAQIIDTVLKRAKEGLKLKRQALIDHLKTT